LCFFDSWIRDQDPGWKKNPDPGYGLNIPDNFSKRLEIFFWVKTLKFFDADPGFFGSWIRDGKIRIWDPV
jgi:hypothetical protein